MTPLVNGKVGPRKRGTVSCPRWHSQEKTKPRVEGTFSGNELPGTKEEGQERVVSRILGGRCFGGSHQQPHGLAELSGDTSGWGAREDCFMLHLVKLLGGAWDLGKQD